MAALSDQLKSKPGLKEVRLHAACECLHSQAIKICLMPCVNCTASHMADGAAFGIGSIYCKAKDWGRDGEECNGACHQNILLNEQVPSLAG